MVERKTVDLQSGFEVFIINLHSASASSALIEDIFSTFERIHSKLRNRLGVEKRDAKFVKVWEKHVSQPVTYEGGRLYFENYRSCLYVHGLKRTPQKLYRLPPCPTSQKIEDCIMAQFPLNSIPMEYNGYRGCFLALTAHNHMLRYDLHTGQLLQDIYLSPRYKFRQISWDSAGYTFVISSTHQRISSIARQADMVPSLLMVLSLFSIFPLQCIAMMEVDRKIFGHDVTDAMISQSVLITMHQGGVLRFYSLAHILEQGKLFDLVLGAPHPSGSQEGQIGASPNGIPINVKLKERPSALFEVRCSEHKLCIGGIPWHYIITPHGYHGFFNVHTMYNHKMVEHGNLDMGIISVEPDKCFFHADESGRILHIGTNQVRVLKISEDVTKNPPTENLYSISEDFTIKAQETEQPHKDDCVTYTSSGRAVKRQKYRDNDTLCDTQCESLQAVDYEDDLDLLVVTSVQQEDDHYRGRIHFHDNLTGQLLQEITLQEPWKEFCDHVVAVDLDTIVHIVKGPMRKFDVYVYRLDRSLPGKAKPTKRKSSRRHSKSSQSSQEHSSEQIAYTNIRTTRRSTRSYSSIR